MACEGDGLRLTENVDCPGVGEARAAEDAGAGAEIPSALASLASLCGGKGERGTTRGDLGLTVELEGFKRLALGGDVKGEMYMGLEGEKLVGDCGDIVAEPLRRLQLRMRDREG